MKMTKPKQDDDTLLDDLFAQARQVSVQPPEDLVARIMADAAAQQQASDMVQSAPSVGLFSRLLETLGGWPAVSGLAAATVAGVWIGVAPPSSVEAVTAPLLGESVAVSLLGSELDFGLGELVDG